jgi:hypothetical protein
VKSDKQKDTVLFLTTYHYSLATVFRIVRRLGAGVGVSGGSNRLPAMYAEQIYGQAERAIRTGKLNVLPRLHLRPINVVVFDGPS